MKLKQTNIIAILKPGKAAINFLKDLFSTELFQHFPIHHIPIEHTRFRVGLVAYVDLTAAYDTVWKYGLGT